MGKTITIGEWADALRSGEYSQGRGQLRSSYGYCCLGVLCDLFDPDAWTGFTWIEPGATYGGTFDYMPPESVVQRIEKLTDYLAVTDDGQTVQKMNDNGADFAAIADVIESRYDRSYTITLEGGE